MSELKKSKWFAKSTTEDRFIFLALFLAILFTFSTAFLYKSGIIKFGFSDGCSFYRNFGIPCPTCYWTRALDAFVKYGTTKAFIIQPAATTCYIILIFVAFFSLLSSILGVNFVFLPSIRLWRIGYIAITATIIVLIGWAITIIRIKYQN
jgi:hypothetical protein